MVRCGVLIVAMAFASPALAQQQGLSPLNHSYQTTEPKLELGRSSFTLPRVEYQAPDGTLKISQGIVVGRDVSPNTRVGLGLFRMKPKYDEDSGMPTGGRSKKVALGVSLRF